MKDNHINDLIVLQFPSVQVNNFSLRKMGENCGRLNQKYLKSGNDEI